MVMLLCRLPMDAWDAAPPQAARAACRDVPAGRLNLHGWIAALLVLELAGLAVGIRAMQLGSTLEISAAAQAWAGLAGAVALWLLAAHGQQLYDEASLLSNRAELPRAALAVTTTFGIVLLVAIGCRSNDAAAPGWEVGCAVGAAGWMLLARGIWSACLDAAFRAGRHVERVLVVAETPLSARWAAARIERSTTGRVYVAATTALFAADTRRALGLAHGMSSIAAIETAVRDRCYDRVLIVASDGRPTLLDEASTALVARLSRLAVDVTIIPGGNAQPLAPGSARRLGGLTGIDLVCRPFSKTEAVLKRAEDIVAAALILLVASPVMLVAAVLIRLGSPGPVLFSQPRYGFHDEIFRMWKFRTMYVHPAGEAAPGQTSRGDPRVTPVGRLLRRTSLDELPQFLNVLLGDMSIVGPRPHAVGMTVAGQQMHELVDGYSARHRIKPGITGWAQVNGCRGEITTKQKLCRRVALDCHYITNWSLALDLYVMARTTATLLFDRQAY